MARRSFRASPQGIAKAKQAFDRKGWTQDYLASEAGLSSRQSVWKFFTGRPIERYIFQEICFRLDLTWEEIVEFPQELSEGTEIETLISNELNSGQTVEDWANFLRKQRHESIQTTCNKLQSSLDLLQPQLSTIYTAIALLSQPTHQRWLEVADLQKQEQRTERFSLSAENSPRLPSIEAITNQSKLVILGKPGAGKTTFLQHLALECDQGNYKPELVPFFLSLQSLSEENIAEENFNFLDYLYHVFTPYNVTQKQILQLLQAGKFLFLFDGFDEIPLQDRDTIFHSLDKFSQDYYKNQIIITSRNHSLEFTFRRFNYVEIADFTPQQIEIFAQKWFVAVTGNSDLGREKAEHFLTQLNSPQNRPIQELGITPILLNLICSVFQERGSFPAKRSKLYQAGLDILLQRWDQAKGIQRDQIYHNLALSDKIKLLGQIAATTFGKEAYFFEVNQVLNIIETYLESLSPDSDNAESLWLDSEAVLKAIALQHGILVERARDIYSFSHLTFQEYLTARHIVERPKKERPKALTKLAQKLSRKNWREVILLSLNLLPNANFLIEAMKQAIDDSVDRDLQAFLTGINHKVINLHLNYHPAALRAYYFNLFHYRDLNLAIALDQQLANRQNLSQELALDSALARIYTEVLSLTQKPDSYKYLNLCFSFSLEQKFILTPDFANALQQLKAELPDPGQSETDIITWWTEFGYHWLENFHQHLVNYRGIGQYWQINSQQIEKWYQYYQDNLFLVECLQSDCQISSTLRQFVESTLMMSLEDQ